MTKKQSEGAGLENNSGKFKEKNRPKNGLEIKVGIPDLKYVLKKQWAGRISLSCLLFFLFLT